MKNNKLLPVIIGILCFVLVGIIIFAIFFLNKDTITNLVDKEKESDEPIAPVIELSLNTTEADQNKVTIYVDTYTDDKDGINYIELPNKQFIYADKAEYEVSKNGNYKFKVVGKNEAVSTLSIEVSNVREISAGSPYIPEGFEHIGGETDEGFVIQDKYGNQYVWVPVPNGILTRSTMMSTDYEESNSSATALVNSVAKYYGFYIGRFEASAYEINGKKVAASIASKMPWTDIQFRDVEQACLLSAEAFGYEDAATSLISSYAWDTTLKWIDETIVNYSTNTSYGNYSGTIYPTGSTESDEKNHIFDLAGNVREWTTEQYNPINGSASNINKRVVRGGSANLNKIPNSRNGYPEDLTDEYWGFRMVLYQNT